MQAFIQWMHRTRLDWFIAKRTLGYTREYLETFYRIYLNHAKVIHYRYGYPVYSISTPAAFSKPMANLVARSFYRGVQNKNMPNLLSFAVNDQCNAGCAHCSFYNGVADNKRKPMTTPQAKHVIRDAQELGVTTINFVGGEPLMHPDLPEIIGSVNKDFSCTVLFTNGWFLEERVGELVRSGLDGVYISLDSADPATHDEIRKKKGLYEKALAGIAAAKKTGITTGISMVLTHEGFKTGELTRMIELGKQIGVHEILIFDVMPTGRLGSRTDIIDDQEWIEDLISYVKPYNEKTEYPGILVYAYATSHRAVGCSCGTSYCYISPYGDMMPCDFNHLSFGNVLSEPFWRVWERLSNSEKFCTASWGGCKMKSRTARKEGYARTNTKYV